MKKLFFTIFIAIFLSCENKSEDVNPIIESTFRTEFIADKDPDVVRAEFIDASFDVKQKLWIDKLNSLSEQNFSEEIKVNINTLVDFLEDYENDKKFSEFKKSAIRLSQIIPAEDFKLMFNSLEDYKYKGSFEKNYVWSSKFSKYIDNTVLSVGINNNITARKDCNCTWCLFTDDSFLSRDCKETRNGCGFLWMQPCKKVIHMFQAPSADEENNAPEREELE